MFDQKHFDQLIYRARICSLSHDTACRNFHDKSIVGSKTEKAVHEYRLNQVKYWYREKKLAQTALLAYIDEN
jgi:hypothetical protein